MKLSFSTLGCPGWSLAEVIAAARRYGYEGVELRGLAGELDIRKLPDFSAGCIAESRALIAEAGVDLVSLDSSARLCCPDAASLRSNMAEARDYIELAGRLGAPLVRLFGGWIPAGTAFVDAADQVAASLSQLGDMACEVGVAVALETHDSFLRGRAVAEIMQRTRHDAVGVVWDISNCHWTGEPIEETAELVGPHLRLVHVKDSVWADGEAQLTFIGAGDVPIQRALTALKGRGYDGYLSYEWEKVWQPDLPDAVEAFPQYVAQMRAYLAALS
jgi:sugar phosphate isomerase/epimerase